MRPPKRNPIAAFGLGLTIVLSGVSAATAGAQRAAGGDDAAAAIHGDETALQPPVRQLPGLLGVVGRPGGPATVSQPLAYYVTDPDALALATLLERTAAPAPKRPVDRPTTRPQAAANRAPEETRAAGPSLLNRRVQPLFGGRKRDRQARRSASGPPRAHGIDVTTFDDTAVDGSGSAAVPIEGGGSAAAGPEHAIRVTDSSIQLHPRSSSSSRPSGGAPLTWFFARLGCPAPATASLPQSSVLFDQHAGRFVLIAAVRRDTGFGDAVDDSTILVAVSDDADPAGVWNCTSIPSTLFIDGLDRWADSPAVAIDEEALYVTANLFAFSRGGGGFAGPRLWVIDKHGGKGDGLYSPGGTATAALFDPLPAGALAGTIRPAHLFGTAPSSPNVGTWLVSYDGLTLGGPDGAEVMQLVRLDDPVGPGTPTFSGPFFVTLGNIEDFASRELPAAARRGRAEPIETGDRRTANAVWRNGRLYTATTVVPAAGDPSAGEATVRWLTIDTTTLGAPIAVDGGNIDGDEIAVGAHTFSPSIAVNAAGEVAINFATASAMSFATSAWTHRLATDAPGRTRRATALPAGPSAFGAPANGDCRRHGGSRRDRRAPASGVAIDPANDQCFVLYDDAAAGCGDGAAGAFTTVCTCVETLTLAAGTRRDFSLPCAPGTAGSVAAVLGDDLEGVYGVDWVVSRRDAETDTDIELRPDDPLTGGEGYQIVTRRADQSITVEGAGNQTAGMPLLGFASGPPAAPTATAATAATASTAETATGCAGSAGRCNLVGNPHRSEVCWADALVADGEVVRSLAAADPANACQTGAAGCVMSRLAHEWTGAAYAPFDGITPGMEGSLQPWDAFRVSANKSGLELRLPVAAGGCGGREAMAGARPARPPWFIRLIATAGALVDSSNVLGQAASSVDGYDSFDLQELDPFGNDYLTIVFPHPDWGPQAGNYSSDFHSYKPREAPEVWSFEVRSSNPSATVTVTWEGPPSRIRRSQLVDTETGTTLLATAAGSYEFTMTGTSRSFTWTVWPNRGTRPRPRPRP